MKIKDFGNSLIDSDIGRLKKLKSLEKDLDNYFITHVNQLNGSGRLSCQIASGKDYIVCKQRIAISKPKFPPSKGGRLWFVITRNGYYIRCLLYMAKEEKNYKKSICFRIVKERLETILQN